jgi:hypothetical protein
MVAGEVTREEFLERKRIEQKIESLLDFDNEICQNDPTESDDWMTEHEW